MSLPEKYKNMKFKQANYIDDLLQMYDADVIPQTMADLKHDIDNIIADYLATSEDKNADKGMQACYLETWQSCAWYIGNTYSKKYGLCVDIARSAANHKTIYDVRRVCDLMDLYACYCMDFRKQFFISDFGHFCGLDFDYIYDLTYDHSEISKKAHKYVEDSMRSGLIGNRGNSMGYAMLLNHDFGYATSRSVSEKSINIQTSASELPTLSIENDTNRIESVIDLPLE